MGVGIEESVNCESDRDVGIYLFRGRNRRLMGVGCEYLSGRKFFIWISTRARVGWGMRGKRRGLPILIGTSLSLSYHATSRSLNFQNVGKTACCTYLLLPVENLLALKFLWIA